MKTLFKGTSPLIVQKPTRVESNTRRKPVDIPPEDKLYVTNNVISFPNRNVLFTIREGASRVIERNRTTYKNSILGMVSINSIWIPLLNGKGEAYMFKNGNTPFTVFGRFIKRSNGERIWVESPMFEDWMLEFDLNFSDDISQPILKEILDISGRMAGFGAFRIGGFGRFTVEVD